MAELRKPPYRGTVDRPSVFLAGSIEMGKARDWQKDAYSAVEDLPVLVFSPRRDDWDPSWEQDISCPQFKEQVVWELDHLDEADVVLLYFDPEMMSAISLEELGLYASSGKLVVCCPKGYWRRGNVQVTCWKYEIPLVETLEEQVELVRKRLVERLSSEGS